MLPPTNPTLKHRLEEITFSRSKEKPRRRCKESERRSAQRNGGTPGENLPTVPQLEKFFNQALSRVDHRLYVDLHAVLHLLPSTHILSTRGSGFELHMPHHSSWQSGTGAGRWSTMSTLTFWRQVKGALSPVHLLQRLSLSIKLSLESLWSPEYVKHWLDDRSLGSGARRGPLLLPLGTLLHFGFHPQGSD